MADKSIQSFCDSIKPYTLEKPERKPKQNYISILILRELQSAARFTTDGTEANSSIIRIGEEEVTVGKLFGRKQVASDRRIAKALQRDLIAEKMNTFYKKGDWSGCSMEVTKMCQKCPECALFGSAASEGEMSVTSRVMYDEAYTIRSINSVVEEFFQNAPGDDYAKKPTSGIREPDFFKEGTLFPCVVTLRDVTCEEVLFFLNITDRNTRYGATGTRFGKTRNHILGIFASNREGPSSLEISRGVALRLAGGDETKLPDSGELKNILGQDSLPLQDVKKYALDTYQQLDKTHRIAGIHLKESEVSALLETMKEDTIIKETLLAQIDKISEFLAVQ
ncbi:type I-D CRISPR-associated protein Cas7/Csc2 [Methanospirillum purgamenti]|uniref:Type I-D CRISPR-associated protein Cas7/Csc2 n=1 Tax=Methanospirillum hungatei TaxID=2203 RepID=A0A8F5ZDZ1_METHU|nr:type I-D CRISPR-associated protein Cas7/Csc2 [Methanospirillum hungatei]QXO94212.1 type I-D CRISPR-associated protein Cas7/Csc2 [Methanospirillum hungatei]